jgi:hypothetical protein
MDKAFKSPGSMDSLHPDLWAEMEVGSSKMLFFLGSSSYYLLLVYLQYIVYADLLECGAGGDGWT